jgi:hypothetical protein
MTASTPQLRAAKIRAGFDENSSSAQSAARATGVQRLTQNGALGSPSLIARGRWHLVEAEVEAVASGPRAELLFIRETITR